jgi:hypothetical protein
MKVLLSLLTALLAGQAGAAACFQLYRGDTLLYQASTPPFDISYDPERGPSAELEHARARGERLIFFPSSCTQPTPRGTAARGETARSLHTGGAIRPVDLLGTRSAPPSPPVRGY